VSAPYRLLEPRERARYWRSFAESAVPGLVTLVLIAATTVPLFATVPVIPDLALLAVLVWATFQPGLMPAWLAFLLGAASDLLSALPLGVHATLLPGVVLFVRLTARFGPHRYGYDWLFAAAVVFAASFVEWQLLALGGVSGPFAPLAIQAAITALTYPAVVALFAGIQRRLALV